MDLVPFQLIRVIFLVLAILSVVVALGVWWFMRKKSERWRKLHLIETEVVVFVILLGFGVFTGVAFSGLFTHPIFSDTVGPSGSSSLTFASVVSFFTNMNDFERVEDISRNATIDGDFDREITHHNFTLMAKEVLAEVSPGITFNYWTYDGQIPAPLLRVTEGDTVTVTLENHESSLHEHSIDLHAVNGPHGGAGTLRAFPGESANFTFTATHPGVYVYHCGGGVNMFDKQKGSSSAGAHMAHGQYGLIIVEPEGGFSEVDREFYLMQGEIYTTGNIGDKGLQAFDTVDYLAGIPTYVVFNGRAGGPKDLTAKTGDRIRLFVGNGGVNLVSSFHTIGEIFDVVHPEASLSTTFENVQTTILPAGGAAVVEFTVDKPGSYILVDHALARVEKGAYAVLRVED